KCVVPETQALSHPGTVVLDEHVRGLRQAFDDLDTLSALQVDGESALVAIHRHERGALAIARDRGQLARGLARLRWLDLDDVRTHVSEIHGAERSRHGLGEVDDPDSLERFHVAVSHPLALPR